LPRGIAPEHIEVLTEQETGDVIPYLKGIEDAIHQAATEEKLFSDLGLPWAKPTRAFSLEGYDKFELEG
jgi:hypothetical protein